MILNLLDVRAHGDRKEVPLSGRRPQNHTRQSDAFGIDEYLASRDGDGIGYGVIRDRHPPNVVRVVQYDGAAERQGNLITGGRLLRGFGCRQQTPTQQADQQQTQ